MPVSPEHRQAIVAFYAQRFGVPESILLGLSLEANKEEIWGGTGEPLPGIASIRPMGLRIGRDFPAGFKPTSVFLAALGPLVMQSRIPVDLRDLRRLLMGQRISCATTDEGYVALQYRGAVLGCGRIHRGKLQALIPTGRRKELLEVLPRAVEPSQTSKL